MCSSRSSTSDEFKVAVDKFRSNCTRLRAKMRVRPTPRSLVKSLATAAVCTLHPRSSYWPFNAHTHSHNPVGVGQLQLQLIIALMNLHTANGLACTTRRQSTEPRSKDAIDALLHHKLSLLSLLGFEWLMIAHGRSKYISHAFTHPRVRYSRR